MRINITEAQIIFLYQTVSKAFEKLVNNMLVAQLEKYGLLPDFQYGFRSFQSTADLMIVVSDRNARAFIALGLHML